MKKAEIMNAIGALDGLEITLRNDYVDNGRPIETINRELVESIESILFRLGNDNNVKWNEQTRDTYQWICDSCIIALYNAGVMNCGFETNTGKSADYDIRQIYEHELCEDF